MLSLVIINELWLKQQREETRKRINPNAWYIWHPGEAIMHCEICLALHGCWFIGKHLPVHPVHVYCVCEITEVEPWQLGEEVCCDVGGLCEYIDVFKELGHDTGDISKIRERFEQQAQKSYSDGNYRLGELSKNGQVISMSFEFPTADGNKALITSKWIVEPNRKLRLI